MTTVNLWLNINVLLYTDLKAVICSCYVLFYHMHITSEFEVDG